MKKTFFLMAIACLTLSSYSKEGATFTRDQTLAQSLSQTNTSSSRPATVELINIDGEQFYNSCTNENMTLYGNIRVVVQFIDNDSKSTFTFHFNGTGVKAIGESGREYMASGGEIYQESWYSNGVITTKDIWQNRYVTAGSESNFFINFTTYVSVDSNGNVTVIRDPVSETFCR